uniref:Uncharacterized protein n=1 Tax=Leersia perrieri TaxID=77586 RepID=A0A0D9W2A7_9ORYZ
MDAEEKKPPAARRASRQGSLRLRALAPGSIDVPQTGDGSCHAGAAAGGVIPLLTPLHIAAAESSTGSDDLPAAASASASRRLQAEVVAGGGGRCVGVEKTRCAVAWRQWHPAIPFVNDQAAASSSSSSVGFVFQNCV